MPRDPAGTYALPGGNPVIGGTTISDAVHNATMADLAAEMTNSLRRSGGNMTGALGIVNGTLGAPGLNWASAPASGFYYLGSNSFAAGIAGIEVQRWTNNNTQSIQMTRGLLIANANAAAGNTLEVTAPSVGTGPAVRAFGGNTTAKPAVEALNGGVKVGGTVVVAGNTINSKQVMQGWIKLTSNGLGTISVLGAHAMSAGFFDSNTLRILFNGFTMADTNYHVGYNSMLTNSVYTSPTSTQTTRIDFGAAQVGGFNTTINDKAFELYVSITGTAL